MSAAGTAAPLPRRTPMLLLPSPGLSLGAIGKRGVLVARPGFVDRQGAAVNGSSVHRFDCRFAFFVVFHLDETETA